MALSEWDQSRLREIEEHTRATDPDFVTRLDLAVVLRHRRQLRRMCWWQQAFGVWMTLMGYRRPRDHRRSASWSPAWADVGSLATVTARGVRLPTPRH